LGSGVTVGLYRTEVVLECDRIFPLAVAFVGAVCWFRVVVSLGADVRERGGANATPHIFSTPAAFSGDARVPEDVIAIISPPDERGVL